MQGFVHDEKAYLMGGVAGHAGLFGTAADVAALAESYLVRCRVAPPRCFLRASCATRLRNRRTMRSCAAGWAGLSRRATKTLAAVSWIARRSAHSGFVGTACWADPSRDLQSVLLTNAVYFGRADTRDIRARFYEAMVQECWPSVSMEPVRRSTGSMRRSSGIRPQGERYAVELLRFERECFERGLSRDALLAALPPNSGQPLRRRAPALTRLLRCLRQSGSGRRGFRADRLRRLAWADGMARRTSHVTLQLGDGSLFGRLSGATVCYDFRSADCAAMVKAHR